MVGVSFCRFHNPGTGMHTFPLLEAFPNQYMCVFERERERGRKRERETLVPVLTCVVCVCAAYSCALTHLELKLSALRNVDINQTQREWCGLEFLLRMIPHTRARARIARTSLHTYFKLNCTTNLKLTPTFYSTLIHIHCHFWSLTWYWRW